MIPSALALPTLAGCAGDVPSQSVDDLRGEEPVASDSQSISGGSRSGPTSSEPLSTVTIEHWNSRCTGTIIGPHHVLTAAHCGLSRGDRVWFYQGAYWTAFGTVKSIYLPAGVDPAKNDRESNAFNSDVGLYDSAGKYADIAVLELTADIPSFVRPALLPASYVGNGDASKGWMVGTGNHNGQANPRWEMQWKATKVYSSSNSDGHMLLDSSDTNEGDSGGPYYTADRATGRLVVHGALHGPVFEWATHAKHTSVSFHLARILRAMGNVPVSGWDYYGGDYEQQAVTFTSECAVACMQDARCVAYTHVPATTVIFPLGGTCFKKSSVGTGNPARNMYSGRKLPSGACTMVNGACVM